MNLWGLFITALIVSMAVSVVTALAVCKIITAVNNREGRRNKWNNKQ